MNLTSIRNTSCPIRQQIRTISISKLSERQTSCVFLTRWKYRERGVDENAKKVGRRRDESSRLTNPRLDREDLARLRRADKSDSG